MLAWDEARRAHLRLLQATGSPAAPYRPRECPVSDGRNSDDACHVDHYHTNQYQDAAVLLPSMLQLLEVFAKECGGDDACRFDSAGECFEHGYGKIGGRCVVPLVVRVVEAERAAQQTAAVITAAEQQTAPVVPPEPLPLAYRLTLEDLWNAVANDSGNHLKVLLARTLESGPANFRTSGQRMVEAIVDNWANGDSW